MVDFSPPSMRCTIRFCCRFNPPPPLRLCYAACPVRLEDRMAWEERWGWTTDKRPIIDSVWLMDAHKFRKRLRWITRGARFDTDGVVVEDVRSNGRLRITVPCTKGSDGRWGLRSEAAARKLEAIVGACAFAKNLEFYVPGPGTGEGGTQMDGRRTVVMNLVAVSETS